MVEAVRADVVLGYVTRIEHLNSEIAPLKDDIKEVLAEAKAAGLDTKMIRRVVRDRKKSPQRLRDETETYEQYAAAAGLQLDE